MGSSASFKVFSAAETAKLLPHAEPNGYHTMNTGNPFVAFATQKLACLWMPISKLVFGIEEKNPETGEPVIGLDGPNITARRTASVSMAPIKALGSVGQLKVAIIGGGNQAAGHLEALPALHPGSSWRKAHLCQSCQSARGRWASGRGSIV